MGNPIKSIVKSALTVVVPRQTTDLARALLRGVLGREPSESEVQGITAELVRHGDTAAVVRDLIWSEEFAQQVVGQLVAHAVKKPVERNVFFMHIPKTAGSSVRVALAHAMGIPAMQAYPRWVRLDRSHVGFWPLWAGHLNIASFPASHRGFSVLREPRARVLSAFRQQQKRQFLGVERLELPAQADALSRARPNASTVTEEINRRGTRMTAFFLPNQEWAKNSSFIPQKKDIDLLSEAERRERFRQVLPRFESIVWAHDEPGILAGIEKVTGVRLDTLPRENIFQSRPWPHEQVNLSSEDMAALAQVNREESWLIDEVARAGHLEPLDPKLADSIFEQTASRLGFTLG